MKVSIAIKVWGFGLQGLELEALGFKLYRVGFRDVFAAYVVPGKTRG